jgi:uncharacterized protein YjiS (DUF1127 family)
MDEFHEYQLLGRRLQAQAMASAITVAFRGLVWPFKKLAAAYARASREAASIRQLSALDDHLLADLGISRSQIPAAVAGLLEPQTATQPAAGLTVEPLRSEAARCEQRRRSQGGRLRRRRRDALQRRRMETCNDLHVPMPAPCFPGARRWVPAAPRKTMDAALR